ncbi:MAG: TIGR03960 family B12-binding radical SAM protein [Polyangiaceae bacterium]
MSASPPSFAHHPYASFLHEVSKPARYTGGEIGVRRKDWASVEATICLAFPDVYDIGMSHLGYKILYKILNDDPRTLAERSYAPWPDMEAQLRQRKLPLVSHESARPLRDFDVIGLSLQFELTYTNCLTILDLGGVPIRAADRGDNDPLVIGGGPTATHPEPLAVFFDAFVIGDGEEACTNVALTWARLKKEGVSRQERLVALSKLPGVYVPSLYVVAEQSDTGLECVVGTTHPEVPKRVRRAFVEDLNKFPFPNESPVGGPEAIFDRMSIEIARGCTEGCRFCQAGMIYRPVRERDPETIVSTVIEAVKKTGHDDVSLTSLSTADASCISPLIKKVADRLAADRVSLGVSSLRAYGLEDDLLDEMKKVRATGLTFAPEAGTQRMRDVINKNVTEDQLLDTARRVFSKGWDRMKLYFMIGQPTETDEDVIGIVETGKRALAQAKEAKARKASVTVSVSTHVPKPHTPFQWCAMDPLPVVEHKQALLRQAARGSRIDLKTHDATESVLEGVFARGDRRLGDAIEEAWRNGARFDSWEEHVKLDVWKAAFEKFGIDTSRYLGTIPVTARLPWDHIDAGLEDGFLAREYRQALRGKLSPPCGKAVGQFIHHTNVEDAQADKRKLVCYDCGVSCDMSNMREQRVDYLKRMGANKAPVRLPLLEAPAAEAAPTTIEEGAVAAVSNAGESSETGELDLGEVAFTTHVDTQATTEKAAKPKNPRARRQPPGHNANLPSFRYRFGFEKIGPIALLGHLDLIRVLPRIFRRIEVAMAYTEGFHPKPDMVFAPALSLGVPSLHEYVDVKLQAKVDPTTLLDRMNEACPEGLRFTAAAALGPTDPGLNKVIGEGRYALIFARSALPDAGASLEQDIARVNNASELPIVRVIEGLKKKLDVKTYLRSVALETQASKQAAFDAGFLGDLITVEARIAITGSGSIKASEVAEVLVGAEVPHRAVRMALLTDSGMSPIEYIGKAPGKTREPRAASAEAAVEAVPAE